MSFDELVERRYGEIVELARVGGDWERQASSVGVPEPGAFLDWARDHRRWRFAVAEAADEVCAKPPEAAAQVMLKILEELLEERGVTD